MKYPTKILALLTHKGYDNRYYHHCKTSDTYQEAYEKTEKEFNEYYDKRKYASYDSFRVAHNKRLKRYEMNRFKNT